METEKSNQQKQYPGVGYEAEDRIKGDKWQDKTDKSRMQGERTGEKTTSQQSDKDGCVCDPCECEPCTCDSKPNAHMEGIDTAYGQCSCSQKEVVVMEDDTTDSDSNR